MAALNRPTYKSPMQPVLHLDCRLPRLGETFVCRTDDDGVVQAWNDTAHFTTGFCPSEVLGHNRVWSWLRSGRHSTADASDCSFNYFRSTGEKEVVTKEGHLKHIGLSVVPAIDIEEESSGLLLLGCELKAYDSVQQIVMQERAYFKALFESSPDSTVLVDTARRVMDANPAFQSMFGYSLDEMRGRDIHEFIMPPGHAHESHEPTWQQRRGTIAHRRAKRKRRDGVKLDVSIVGAPVVVAGQEYGMLSIYRDITDFMTTEQALRESARFSHNLLERSPNPVVVFNPDTSVRYVNYAWEMLTGYSAADILGTRAPYVWWCPETHLKSKADVLENFSRGIERLEHVFRKRNGDLFWVEITHTLVHEAGQTQYVLSSWVDVTDRKLLERQRVELEYRAQVASRLAVAGKLAAGIAHEINNPLAGIVGLSDLLLQQPLSPETREYVALINESATRGAAILKGLLTFSRQRKPLRQVVDIDAVVDTALRLEHHELVKGNITVHVQSSPEPKRTHADPGQLQEVFINLIDNAKAAMTAEHGGGTLTIRSRLENASIVVEVEDDGPGIGVDDLSNIFDPFFTTRNPGEGTGLGLSICHGIVKEHLGRISVRSTTGEGATFIVELPICSDDTT